MNNIPLSPCNSVEYLDIYIDEQLNFKCDIKTIEQKISLAVDIAKLKSFLPSLALPESYLALIYSPLLYGLAI